MPTFSKIIAFPPNAALHLGTYALPGSSIYPRFAEAFGNRKAAPSAPLPVALVPEPGSSA